MDQCYFSAMIRDDSALSHKEVIRRPRSSIRCSRQTQRTQLENTKDRSTRCERPHHLFHGCYTNDEVCTMGQKSGQDDSGGNHRQWIFTRGFAQLRDSRRKTAEYFRSSKDPSKIVSGNGAKKMRSNQDAKLSLNVRISVNDPNELANHFRRSVDKKLEEREPFTNAVCRCFRHRRVILT